MQPTSSRIRTQVTVSIFHEVNHYTTNAFLFLSLPPSLSLYIYIYIYIYKTQYIYIYIYIYRERERERKKKRKRWIDKLSEKKERERERERIIHNFLANNKFRNIDIYADINRTMRNYFKYLT